MEQIKEDDLKKIQELNNGETITVDFVKKHDTSKSQYKNNPETEYTAEFSKKEGGIYSYKIIKENCRFVNRENVDFIIVSSFQGFSQLNIIDKLKNSYTTFPNSTTILQTSSSIQEKGGMNSLYQHSIFTVAGAGFFAPYGMIVDIPSTNEMCFTKTDCMSGSQTNVNDTSVKSFVDKKDGMKKRSVLQKNINRQERRQKSAISNILHLNNQLYRSNQKLQNLDEQCKPKYNKKMIEFDKHNKLKKYYWNELFHQTQGLETKCNGLFINLIPENIDFICNKSQKSDERKVIERCFSKLNIQMEKNTKNSIPIKKIIEIQKKLFKTDKIMLIDWENNKFDYLPIKEVLQKLLNRYDVLCEKYKIEKNEKIVCNIKSELEKIKKEEELKLLKTPISQLSARNSTQPIIDYTKRKRRIDYCNAIRSTNLKNNNKSQNIKSK